MKDQVPKRFYLSQLSEYVKVLDNIKRVHIALIKAENLIRRKWDWGTKLGPCFSIPRPCHKKMYCHGKED
jgi:hypothetical protein